jgi:hypothetical protein
MKACIFQDVIDLFCIIYIPPDVTHVPPRKSRAKLADRTEHASVPPAVAGQPEGVAVIFRRMPYGTDFERLNVFEVFMGNNLFCIRAFSVFIFDYTAM